MNITQTAVKRPIATTMVFLIIIVLGISGLRFLPVDLLPPIEYPMLAISTTYPNVGPEEIETIITDRIENAIASVPNLTEVRSDSEEGRSRVRMEFASGTDIDAAANDVRAALDRIRDDFPPEVEPPRLWKFDPDNFPVAILGAQSQRSMDELTLILEREIAQRFEQLPGVGSIDVWGGIYREIQVQLMRDRLASSGLSAADVRAALQRENVTLPGGDVREGISDMYIRTRGEYQSLEEIASTIITVVDGYPIRVRDIASVVDGFEDVNRIVQIDGRPMVRLGIRKQSGANTVAVARQVREVMEQINGERVARFKSELSDVRYYLCDHLGSVVGMVKSDGSLTNWYQYHPFGDIFQRTAYDYNSFEYTSKEREAELSVVWNYYGARYYDPKLRIFTQVDPSYGRYPAWGPYVYTLNNPLKYIDREGMYADLIWDIPLTTLSYAEFEDDPSTLNAIGLGLDVAGCAIPAVPAVGGVLLRTGARWGPDVASWAKKAWRAIRGADKAAEAVKGIKIESGMTLYRVAGGKAKNVGKYWTTLDPRTVKNARGGLGLPPENTGEYVITATLRDPAAVIEVGPAKSYGPHPGGLPEIYIDNPKPALEIIDIEKLEKPL